MHWSTPRLVFVVTLALSGSAVAAAPERPSSRGNDPPLKLSRPALPPAGAAGDHPIDRLLAPYFAAHQVQRPAPAAEATFVRRAHEDLIGLLPGPDEVAAFAADTRPDKHARLVESLLSDRRAVADHWLSFWNDLLRNDYAGTGFVDKGRSQITAWLYPALVDNLRYDEFTRQLISPNEASAGFIGGIKWRGRINASQTPEVQFSQNVSQVFFGINMKCASCHDSFIDHWTLAEAYSLAAVVADKPLEIHRCDKATGQMATPGFLWPELGSIDPSAPREERLKQLAALITHRDNGRYSRTIVNRLWQRLFGRGLIEPVDVMANPTWSPELLDYLAGYLVDNDYDSTKLIAHICTSRIYQARAAVATEESPDDFVFRGPQVKRMTAEQLVDAVWQLTGAGPEKRQAPVTPPRAARPDRELVRAALVKSDLLMRSLGRPNREQVVTTRGQQLTMLQALDLSNGQILYDTLRKGATQLLKNGPSAQSLTVEIWQHALSRPPTADEFSTAAELLGEKPSVDSVADLLWCVVMLPEFQLID